MALKTNTDTKPPEITKKKFSYVIKDGQGKLKEGIATATSPDSLVSSFTKRGFQFIEEPREISNTGLNMELSFGKGKRVKPREVAHFARKFSSMQDAGVPIKTILKTLAGSSGQNPTLSSALKSIEADIDTGLQFSTALARHPLIFSPLVIAMVKSGEEGGFLDKAMRQVAENLESEVRLKSEIKSAMTYPVVVLMMAALMCAAMLLFIVPIFDEMFSSLGSELPLPTQVLVHLSDFLKVGIGPLVMLIVGVIIWWNKNKHLRKVRAIKDPLVLKIPIAGQLIRKIVMSRFSRNLGTLLDNGVPIMQALKIVGETTGSIVVEDALVDVSDRLLKGSKMSDGLARHDIFPPEDIAMIGVGEESGDISPMLLKIAEIYDEDVAATTKALTSLIEPLMIVFLGVVVGGMIVALYMPIFSIADAVKNS